MNPPGVPLVPMSEDTRWPLLSGTPTLKAWEEKNTSPVGGMGFLIGVPTREEGVEVSFEDGNWEGWAVFEVKFAFGVATESE